MTLPIYETVRTEAKVIANGIRTRLYVTLGLDPIDYSKNENNSVAKKFAHALKDADASLEFAWNNMDSVQCPDKQSVAEYRSFVKQMQSILNDYNDTVDRLIENTEDLADYIDHMQKRAAASKIVDTVMKNPSNITKNINGSVDNLKGAETVSLDDSGNIKPEDKK